MKLDLLVLAAHPDDAELCCSGTVIAHIAQGKKAGMIDFTRGEMGTRGTPEIRLEEAKKASKIMGLSARENMYFKDVFFKNDYDHQLALASKIRKYQPEIVLTNAKTDRHPDHGKAADLAREACFIAGLRKVETKDENGREQEPWRPQSVYHFLQNDYHNPDFVVDITDYWEQKLEAIKAYQSQFYNPESNEPISYVATERFWRFIEGRAREMGHAIGVPFGEGFLVNRQVGVKSLFDLI